MNNKQFLAALVSLVFLGCNNNPKVIPINSGNGNSNESGIFSGSNTSGGSVDFNSPTSNEFHSIVVTEVLPTSKYVYLNVTEGDETYWIAARSMDVKVGEAYYYKGGLLKTNFESKEYNRVFDKVILVSSLVAAANHGNEEAKMGSLTDNSKTPLNTSKQDIEMHTEKVVHRQGSMKISELVKNPKKYEGQTIQIDGVCTKINAGIMDRNWIHIKDGSKDDFDLVITSDAFIPEGALFTIKAVVVLNKDFGAGYKYDLILENGTLVK
jgi:hypothetical protein